MKSQTEKIEFLRSIFGSAKVSREGSNVAVKCPSCGEKKGKFSININTWMCHCWVCGVKSKNLYFILKKHSDRSASNQFVKEFGSPRLETGDDCAAEEEDISLPDDFILLASASRRDPDVRSCISYCKKRGLTDDDLWYFRIGTSNSSEYRRRIIIPSFDYAGKLNYFVTRTIDRKGFPKYVNSIAKKTEIIFNEMNVDWRNEVSLLEGPFDLIKADKNSTCLLGSKLSQKSKLFNKIIENKTPVLLALDPDMKIESHNIAKSLSRFGCSVRILYNNTDMDVGDMSKKEFSRRKEMSQLWSRESSIRFKIASLQSGSLF